MNCPNCGLANPDGARFCANCGTSLTGAPLPPPSAYQGQSQYQAPPPFQGRGGNTTRNIALGCLVLVLIFLFFGLSCTRACFGFRHNRVYLHRRY